MRAIAGAVLAVALVVAIGLGFAVWAAYLRDLPALPAADRLDEVNRAPAIRFLDRGGQTLAARGARYGDRVRLADLPEHVPLAFLAAEDRRFYQHGAVDLASIARAAWVNWRAGGVAQGGSTLTQQLAKTLFLTSEQSMKRKVQEAVLAQRLEAMLSKDAVLELYLNRVFFGAGAYGIDGAARTYFGKPAARLTLSEAALLAALPKAPSRLAPTRNLPAALERSRRVLAQMRETGWITPEEEARALADPPRLVPPAPEDPDFGYVLDYATAEAVRLAGPRAPDLVVRLAIDPRLQKTATLVVRRAVQEEGRRAGVGQAALVALARDGGVRAMVGGVDYQASAYNRAVQARRQPGSTFKPFVFAAALERGLKPTDIRQDAPVRFGSWTPGNYGGGYRGPVTLETALAWSLNTVAVRLAGEVGPANVAALATRFGITGLPARPGPSVALGAYEVSVLEMASAFQVFQNGGARVEPYIVEQVATSGGRVLYARAPDPPAQAYDAARAAQMVRMLEKVVAAGTGTRAAFGWPAAGKTGTSQDWRDAWFVGFTPEFAAAVWVGDDQNRPMDRVSGGDLPAQVWRRFMSVAHEGLAVRGFDGLASGGEQAAPDPRNGFYETLAAEFARAAAEAETAPP